MGGSFAAGDDEDELALVVMLEASFVCGVVRWKAYCDWRCICQRPVRGKKKPSATTLARAFAMGFCRVFSTAMREENVRTLRALGPDILSAASAAMGWIMLFSSRLVMAFIGAASKV